MGERSSKPLLQTHCTITLAASSTERTEFQSSTGRNPLGPATARPAHQPADCPGNEERSAHGIVRRAILNTMELLQRGSTASPTNVRNNPYICCLALSMCVCVCVCAFGGHPVRMKYSVDYLACTLATHTHTHTHRGIHTHTHTDRHTDIR